VFKYSFLYLIEAEMVFIKDSSGIVKIEIVFRIKLPWKIAECLYIVYLNEYSAAADLACECS
jgi:hypothetical protein